MMSLLRRAAWRGTVVLATLLTMLLVAGLVYVWRSQPVLDGELRAAGLQDTVRIARDGADVTHIQASTVQDASFALGWVHAQERSWQLEFNRRLMRGQLSEVFGPQTLETDKLMRTLGIVQAAQAQWRTLPQAIKTQLNAYADGINSFHAQSAQALPPEFHILRVRPGAWTAEDSVGWALMMALDLGGNWGNEFARLTSAKTLSTRELWQLFPPYPGEPPASSVDFAKLYKDWGLYRQGPAPQSQLHDATKNIAGYAINTPANGQFGLKNEPSGRLQADLNDWLHNLGDPAGKGSNNWVIAGNASTSGKPILANDPHLGLSAPAIWYFARLQAASGGPGGKALDVVGATLPGLPSVVLGRTANVAWAFTNTGPDVQDLYIERINPANPQQYQSPSATNGGWADFQTREETIAIKGQGAQTITVRSTRHGPVLSDHTPSHQSLLDTQSYVLALRWSALDADNQTVLGGFEANFAQSVPELLQAYRAHHSPMQNLVAADTAGQTVFQTIGRVPLRSKADDIRGVAPAPGWDARYDWAGWLTPEQNPGLRHEAIAKKGWFSTANQRIHSAGFAHFMGQDWANPDRLDRIETLLSEAAKQSGGKQDVQTQRAVQADTLSYAAQRLAPALRAAAQRLAAANSAPLAQTQTQTQAETPTQTQTAAAQAALQNFAGQMDAASPAPLIFAAWADELTRALIEARVGTDAFKRLYGKRHFRGLIESVVLASEEQGGDPGVFKGTPMGSPMSAQDAAAWCAPQTCAEQSTQALGRALAKLQAAHGADVAQWRWGQGHLALSSHKPFGNVPLLARWFDVAVESGGDPWTVNVGQYWPNQERQPYANRHAASLRALYDLANLENSQFIYQTGQSGLVWSPRYRDMANEWASVQYRPLQLRPQRWAHELTLRP
jgi:penicillin G amidase